MQKIVVEKAGASLRGPGKVRLFDMSIQMRNQTVLGARWPRSGVFTLPEGAEIELLAGDVVAVSDPSALEIKSVDGRAPKKEKGKSPVTQKDRQS